VPIITLAEYKVYAGISGTAQDAKLNVQIPAIQAQLETLCNRKFDSAARTEYYDGGNRSIVLQNAPATVLTSVKVVNKAKTALYTYALTGVRLEGTTGIVNIETADLAGTYDDYAPLPGSMTFEPSPQFPRGWRNIEIVNTAGYADVDMPVDLKLLMYDLVATSVANAGVDQSMKGETLGHYKYERQEGSWWDGFMYRIQAWKRISA